jgi:hypothetical protein
MSRRPKRKRVSVPHPLTQVDHLMIALAADRALVQLASGTTARLVAWKPHQVGKEGRRLHRRCRVEFPGGGQATLAIEQVVGVVSDDGGVHYLSETAGSGA